jgi:hypothetical protein
MRYDANQKIKNRKIRRIFINVWKSFDDGTAYYFKPEMTRFAKTTVKSKEEWCARQDLNLHALRHYHLKVARLPIPPRAQERP